MLHFTTDEEWARILDFMGNGGKDKVRLERLDPATNRFVCWNPITPGERVSLSRFRDEHDSSDVAGVRPSRCPFITFDVEEGVYACSIHPVKPAICKAYTCDANTRFGIDDEYCHECMLADPAGLRPCEHGSGCAEMVERARYFVRFSKARHHCKGTTSRASYFAALLDINISTFRRELEAQGASPGAIKASLAPMHDLLEALARPEHATGSPAVHARP